MLPVAVGILATVPMATRITIYSSAATSGNMPATASKMLALPAFPKNRYQIFERFYLLLQSAHENPFDFSLRVFERANNSEGNKQCSG
jgi:hypothetical protein